MLCAACCVTFTGSQCCGAQCMRIAGCAPARPSLPLSPHSQHCPFPPSLPTSLPPPPQQHPQLVARLPDYLMTRWDCYVAPNAPALLPARARRRPAHASNVTRQRSHKPVPVTRGGGGWGGAGAVAGYKGGGAVAAAARSLREFMLCQLRNEGSGAQPRFAVWRTLPPSKTPWISKFFCLLPNCSQQ